MRRLFSTEGSRAQNAFCDWRDICEDRLVPMSQAFNGNGHFCASIDGDSIGGLSFTRFALNDINAATNHQTIRHRNNKTDYLYLSIVLEGSVISSQNDRVATDHVGDMSVRDTNTPWAIEHRGYTDVLAVEIARERLENIVGSARHFAGLTMRGDSPVTTLARSFLCDFVRMGDQFTHDAAERMASVGIDLVAASLAERMAEATPKPLRGVLTVQRAKAHIAANLDHKNLSPAEVAAAVGVSLRQLQLLFRDNGQNIGAWIWQQRLERAARLLSDRGCLHVPLGEIAFRCGFADPAHFSRRFRELFGISPREYRQLALQGNR